MKKPGPDEIKLSKKKKTTKLSLHLSPGHFPSFVLQHPVVANCTAGISQRGEEVEEMSPIRLEPNDTMIGRFFPPEAILLENECSSWYCGGLPGTLRNRSARRVGTE